MPFPLIAAAAKGALASGIGGLIGRAFGRVGDRLFRGQDPGQGEVGGYAAMLQAMQNMANQRLYDSSAAYQTQQTGDLERAQRQQALTAHQMALDLQERDYMHQRALMILESQLNAQQWLRDGVTVGSGAAGSGTAPGGPWTPSSNTGVPLYDRLYRSLAGIVSGRDPGEGAALDWVPSNRYTGMSGAEIIRAHPIWSMK